MTDQSALTADARAMLAYDAEKKNALIAYILWFFLGFIGAHRFYMGRRGAFWMLALFIVGVLLSGAGIGLLILFVLFIWWIVDAFVMPNWIREHNTELVARITGAATPVERHAGSSVPSTSN